MSTTVVALGGNALVTDQQGTVLAQRETIRRTTPHLADLYGLGHDLVFTHGNGPQIGQLLLQNEASSAPERPLDVLVAETQAQIGYLLQQELRNELGETPATVVTQALVTQDDPAFDEPTKPIGPFYDGIEAAEKSFHTKQVTTSEGETAYRRVVPSPEPHGIVESDQIAQLVATGQPVICAGGGGIPVVANDGTLEGIEAVIDKDRTSRVLGTHIDADTLLLLTDVDCAYRRFGSDEQQRIEEMTPTEARDLLASDTFGEGTMAPKIESAVQFVERGGKRAAITSFEQASEALTDSAGTTISKPA